MAEKAPHDLHTFMAQVTDEMASEYERIFARSSEDPGTAGDEGEENWASLLREWLPQNYYVRTKGRLLGHDGTMSPQIDVVVLKPSYPAKLLEKRAWLSDGVAAAFECKNTLTASHISAFCEKSTAVKALYKARSGSPYRELRSPLFYGLLAHSHSWKGQASKPIDNINNALKAGETNSDHPRLGPDLICVADLATWTSMYIAQYRAAWVPDHELELEKFFGDSWGPMTSMVAASYEPQNPADTFRPIAALLSNLIQRLAWSDPSLRDFADYYRLANLWGNALGVQRPWPASVFSEDVRQSISRGMLVNGDDWSEWTMGGF